MLGRQMGIEVVVVVCGVVVALGAAGIWHASQMRVDPTHLARTPRDLGKLVLNERCGRRVAARVSNGRDPARSDDSFPAPQDQQSTIEGVPNRYAALEAAAQGAWIGLAPLEALLAIDEHVYSEMSRLAGEQLETIGDLSTYLASWPSAEFGSALPDASLNKLMGHLAEPEVAEHLESLGIDVDMPDASNQAGWDLILNGEHMVNVKAVADANALTGHFEQYPDVPVIVPGDMAGIPEQAIHLDSAGSIDQLARSIADGEGNIVIVDHELEQAAMFEHAEEVTDALLGNVELADLAGIPLITLALSGVREVGLLSEDKTSAGNAMKNLSLDVAGTGSGGAGGALIGAEIGSLLGEEGEIVGGLLGAIGGAIFGRSATDRVKREALNKAVKAYKKTSAAADGKVKRIHRRAVQEYTHAQKEQQAALSAVVEQQGDRLATRCQTIIEQHNLGYRLEEEQAHRLLRIAVRDLNRDLRRAQVLAARRVRRCMLPLRFIGVWQPDVREYKAMTLRVQADLEVFITQHRNEDGALEGKAAATFLQTLLSVDAASEQVCRLVHETEDQRHPGESALRDCIHDVREAVARRRHECFVALARRIEEIREQCEKKVRRIRKDLDKLMRDVREEQAKLGMDAS